LSGETEEKQSAWTTDTLREFLLSKINSLQVDFQHQHDDLVNMLNERYETQTKAIDAAFAAQQLAMQTALIAQEKAILAALASTKEAIQKKENSDEKRFETVNEFRQTLSDQAKDFAERSKDFMSRVESDSKFVALIEKFDTAEKSNQLFHQNHVTRLAELDQRLSSRLDLTQGKSTGINVAAGIVVAAISVSVGIIGLIITIIAFQ